jgi:peptide/nickel transport system permease protein
MKYSDKLTNVNKLQSNANILTRSAKKSPQLILGIILTGLVLAITLVSFFWTPWDPIAIDVEKRLLTPSFSHWFGTDRLGRDLLSQIMVGSQNTLYVTLVSTLIGVVLGTSLGLAAAGSGPLWGGILTRISDIGIAIPSILIALVLATTLGPGRLSVIIAISFWFVPVTARVVVGPARQILSLDFVEAAMTHGRTRMYIVFRQVLPNIAPIVIVQTSMMFAAGILIEASLSFLGVGAQPPTTSWGKILMDSQPLVQEAPYYTLLPGSFVVITVLGFNLLGDGLAVLLDPQQSQKGVA